MKKLIISALIIVSILMNCLVYASNTATDTQITSLLNYLKTLDKITLLSQTDPSTKYISITPNSFEYLNSNDKRYKDLKKSNVGKALTINNNDYDTKIPCVFIFKGNNINDNKEETLYIGTAVNTYDPSPQYNSKDFKIFDGEKLFEIRLNTTNLLGYFKTLDKMIILGNNNKIKYLSINQGSIEYISQNDKRFHDLSVGIFGQLLTLNNGHDIPYIFVFKGNNVWDNNKEENLYMAVKIFQDKIQTKYFPGDLTVLEDGENQYHVETLEPKLADDYTDYYKLWDDKTNCPLKIIAYRIHIDEYRTVKVDLVLKNTSEKQITAFKGIFEMFDKMNSPVTWGGGDNKFAFISQNNIIPALSSSLNTGSWELHLYENTRQIKPSINEIQFEDGTTWRKKN